MLTRRKFNIASLVTGLMACFQSFAEEEEIELPVERAERHRMFCIKFPPAYQELFESKDFLKRAEAALHAHAKANLAEPDDRYHIVYIPANRLEKIDPLGQRGYLGWATIDYFPPQDRSDLFKTWLNTYHGNHIVYYFSHAEMTPFNFGIIPNDVIASLWMQGIGGDVVVMKHYV